jgi:hypothetical protein
VRIAAEDFLRLKPDGPQRFLGAATTANIVFNTVFAAGAGMNRPLAKPALPPRCVPRRREDESR